MNATIRDVARTAGVSVATVSRVLNDSGPVRPATRRRVEEAARRLHYVPNEAARTLTTSRTQTIGVLLPDLYGEFFSEAIRGMDEVARANRYHLLVSSIRPVAGDLDIILKTMKGRVDGMIVMTPHAALSPYIARLAKALPILLLNSPEAGSGFDTLRVDNVRGAYRMMHHLYELGHRCIAFIEGPAGNQEAAERRQGYGDAVEACGLTAACTPVLAGDFTEASGRAAARRAVTLTPRPSALFASNDTMAIGAIQGLQDDGYAVPADMAVAGFDDLPMSRYVTPPLTSVRVPIREMGLQAARRLMVVLRGDASETTWHRHLEPELVPRRSCGYTGPMYGEAPKHGEAPCDTGRGAAPSGAPAESATRPESVRDLPPLPPSTNHTQSP